MIIRWQKWLWWRMARPHIDQMMKHCMARATAYRLAEIHAGQMLGHIDLIAREARWWTRLNRMYQGHSPWRALQ